MLQNLWKSSRWLQWKHFLCFRFAFYSFFLLLSASNSSFGLISVFRHYCSRQYAALVQMKPSPKLLHPLTIIMKIKWPSEHFFALLGSASDFKTIAFNLVKLAKYAIFTLCGLNKHSVNRYDVLIKLWIVFFFPDKVVYCFCVLAFCFRHHFFSPWIRLENDLCCGVCWYCCCYCVLFRSVRQN